MNRNIVLINILILLILCGCYSESSPDAIASESDVFYTAVSTTDSIATWWNTEETWSEKIDLDFYYTGEPGFPEESIPNRIILGSAGCCFRARNIELYALDENGKAALLLSEELISNHDTYECISIPKIDTPIEVFLDFTEEYADVKRISLMVAKYSSTDEMLRDGLLLCFEDGSLTVFSGNKKTLYKAGVFSGDKYGFWYQEVDTTASQ